MNAANRAFAILRADLDARKAKGAKRGAAEKPLRIRNDPEDLMLFEGWKDAGPDIRGGPRRRKGRDAR